MEIFNSYVDETGYHESSLEKEAYHNASFLREKAEFLDSDWEQAKHRMGIEETYQWIEDKIAKNAPCILEEEKRIAEEKEARLKRTF